MTSCHPCGRAEPSPPRGDHPTARWPSEESPEMTGNAVFSEGRTPCVRVVRPSGCPGISSPPDAQGNGPLAYRAHASVKPVPSYPGVQSPPLRDAA